MTINPALLRYSSDLEGPRLYPEERLILSRDSIDIDVDAIPGIGRYVYVFIEIFRALCLDYKFDQAYRCAVGKYEVGYFSPA